jgi:hypothetical protein
MPAVDSLARLNYCRTVLVRVTAGLTVEDLDHCAFPDSKSNGEILLHIAGFEFLTVAAAQWLRGNRPDSTLWSILKSGFAREAGFAPPREVGLIEYRQLLDTVRERTALLFGADDGTTTIDAAAFPIHQLAHELAEMDVGEDRERYRRLAASVTTSFADDGVPDAAGMVDLASLLALHETYHRGQITLNKYFSGRLLRDRPRR